MAKTPAVESETLLVRAANDILRLREIARQRRLLSSAIKAALITAPISLWLFLGSPVPSIDPMMLMLPLFLAALLVVMVVQQKVSGASPHVRYSPEQIDITLDDVKGIGPVKNEIIHSLDMFKAKETFEATMGGTARRGILFEGPPGTGKTHTAKALAAEAGVPFLFLPATALQSMWLGGTARKIRSYFKELRKIAREEGGVIGFIEEIDAVALKRGGLSMTPAPEVSSMVTMGCGGLTGLPVFNAFNPAASPVTNQAVINKVVSSEGSSGIVNEFLIQMQSFDEPVGFDKFKNKIYAKINLYLPDGRKIKLKKVNSPNVLILAATNRADNLDPALLRPGRFDRRFSFDPPTKAGRRELIDYFLDKKSHEPELDSEDRRDGLAALTTGYTPVMIENLLDEALMSAVIRNSTKMNWKDIEHARMAVTVGIGQPVEYTNFEERLIASHEAGHAATAWLVANHRRLEVLTIIKRKNALGMLAHNDPEDVYTRQRGELLALIQTAMGGQVAEELLFNDISTGPAGDLAYATNVAVQMVGSAGMGSSLICMDSAGGGMMDQGLVSRVLGHPVTRGEVDEILRQAKESVRELLSENIHFVEALRDALIERKELIGSEITDVLEAAGERPQVKPLEIKFAVSA